ncbi:MAG: hypothetical protein DMF90_13710, partial [Acidobacteria bacterium]
TSSAKDSHPNSGPTNGTIPRRILIGSQTRSNKRFAPLAADYRLVGYGRWTRCLRHPPPEMPFRWWLITIFGTVAMLLAAIGLYGVMSFTVDQRRREIGIRLAVGAGVRDVRNLVMGQGIRYLYSRW